MRGFSRNVTIFGEPKRTGRDNIKTDVRRKLEACAHTTEGHLAAVKGGFCPAALHLLSACTHGTAGEGASSESGSFTPNVCSGIRTDGGRWRPRRAVLLPAPKTSAARPGENGLWPRREGAASFTLRPLYPHPADRMRLGETGTADYQQWKPGTGREEVDWTKLAQCRAQRCNAGFHKRRRNC
jgi:hypothetical protein